ncbi:hypothetical protein D3C81_1129940 [compost metagenome]
MNAHQQHPLGPVDALVIQQCGLALGQPALEVGQAADLGEARGLVFETEHAFQVQQLELGLVQFRQVFLGDGTVVTDHVARQRASLAVAHAAQVLHHLLQGAVVGAHPGAAIAFAPARRFLADDTEQLILTGQCQVEARGITLHFRRQLEGVGNQHQGRLVVALGHGHFLEQAHHPGIVGEEGMQVAQHVKVRLRISLDQLERRFRLAAVALAEAFSAKAQALQAFADSPGEQAETALDRQAGEGFQDATLIPGFDQDQLDPRVQHQAEVVDVVLHRGSW